MTTMALDEAHFARTAMELATVSGRALKDVVGQFAKIAIQECVRMTPPMTYAEASEESGLSQKKIGMNAARAGVNRSFRAWKDVVDAGNTAVGRSLYAGVSRAIRKRNWGAADRMIQRGFRRTKGFVQAATKELHNLQRRKGRVPNNQFPYIVPTSISINRLVRYRQSHVGFAKSGWIPAATALGSKLAGFAWIRGKGGEAYGGITLPTDRNPELVVWNGVPYVQESGRELRIVDRAIKSTIYKMGKAIEAITAKRFRSR